MAVSRKNKSMKKTSKTHKRKNVMKGGVTGRIEMAIAQTKTNNYNEIDTLRCTLNDLVKYETDGAAAPPM